MVQNHHIKRIPTPTPSNGQKKRRYQPAQGIGATSSLTGRRQLTLMLDFLTFIHITYPETKTFALRLYPEQERKVRPSKIPSSWGLLPLYYLNGTPPIKSLSAPAYITLFKKKAPCSVFFHQFSCQCRVPWINANTTGLWLSMPLRGVQPWE